MGTIGWLLLFGSFLVLRQVSKGRGITQIPSDLGDLTTAILTNDRAKVNEVLSRKEDLSLNITDAQGNPSGDVTTEGIPVSKHDQTSLIELGHWLKSQGYSVSEGPPPFGPINGGHLTGQYGYHYKVDPKTGVKGMALDVNWPGAAVNAEETKRFDALAPKLVAAGWHVLWKVPNHYNHLHVDAGPAGR